MGTNTSCEDIPLTDNQVSTSDGYEDEEPPTDDKADKTQSNDDYKERVISPAQNEVVGNIPECAEKQLMPTHNPLELLNWEYLCKEDQKMFKERQNKEKRNDNSKTNNDKVKGPIVINDLDQ